jgi:hypothetical protein
MDESFDVDLHPTSTITVSFGNLPSRPKVLVLPGASFISSE